MAGRLVLVIDADLPVAVRQACADVAARLADQTGKPVTVAATPISRLDALEDSLRRDGAAPSMNFNRPASTTPRPPSSGVSHHGHSHGPGTGHHSP
jgi:hypothetical protein